MDALKKQMHVNALLQCYDALLTETQRRIMHYYFFDDYSLSEIAEITEVSRNAVHDTIQKSIKKLEDYESKLHIMAHQEKRLEIIAKITKIACEDTVLQALLDEIKKVK